MGNFSLHTSTVVLIRNLWTYNISPQFHVVYDDSFDTVHSGDGVPPDSWSDLLIFNRFKSDYDESDFVPELSNEWLTPIEAKRKREAVAERRGIPVSDMVTNGDGRRSPRAPSNEDNDDAPGMPSQRAPCTVDSTVDVSQQRAPNVTPTKEFSDAFESEPSMVDQPAPDPNPVRRYPSCNQHPPERYHQNGYSVIKSYCRSLTSYLLLSQGQSYNNRYLLNLLLDQEFGLYENLLSNTLMLAPYALKVSATHDPDTPRLHEAMGG